MTALASKICREIEIAGAISFARYMELALYTPRLGYYERPRPIGQQGDFFTSVSVGSVFGELLAFQFAEWFDQFCKQNDASEELCLQIVETGAHNGQLASDILIWLRKDCPQVFNRLHYFILEPSLERRNWQQSKLVEFTDKISWCNRWAELPRAERTVSPFTIIFSNELFDAMPVHRFGWDAKAQSWFEWGVGRAGDGFVWKRLLEKQRSSVPFPKLDPALLAVLPDGFINEICPAATLWWKEAAAYLNAGKLLAIDYGLVSEEFLTPERSNGTARAYFQHHADSDLLARPGEQDITAHVNFSALQTAGEIAGLNTSALVSQAKFLTEIAGRSMSDPKNGSNWDEKRRKQFRTLTHPEHLGRPFRVLIQSR